MLVANQIHDTIGKVGSDLGMASCPHIESIISPKAKGEINAEILESILRQSWNRRNTITIMVRDNGNGEVQLSVSVQGSQILHYTEIIRKGCLGDQAKA